MSCTRPSLTGSFPGLIALSVLGVGCVVPTMPPTYSMAKNLRMPRSEAAAPRLSANVSAVVAEVTKGEVAVFFPFVEGSMSLPLGEHYDLAIAAQSGKLTAEGNLSLAAGDRLRLGLLHGAGVGLLDLEDLSVFLDASVGAMLQLRVGDADVAFLGGRFVYSTFAGESEAFHRTTTYVGGTLGAALRVGERMTLTPEVLVASYAFAEDTYLLVMPSLAISADL